MRLLLSEGDIRNDSLTINGCRELEKISFFFFGIFIAEPRENKIHASAFMYLLFRLLGKRMSD